MDLSGQTALITGASSGLGRHFAKVLAGCGARVAIAARRLDRLKVLHAEICAEGGEAAALDLDVRDPAQLLTTVERAENALGPVTILINNAGVTDGSYATKMPLELIDKLLETNVRAPYILSCEVARRLITARRPGRIVNISSLMAFNSGHGAALYSITKAAVIRMTEALAVEWAKFHINVNAIAPGAFASEMMDGMLERLGDITTQFPRGRLGQPHQLDSSLLYLVAPSSEFVTGTYVKVDDGQNDR